MITSIFIKSKPINFIVAFTVIFLTLMVLQFKQAIIVDSFSFFKIATNYIMVCLSVFVLNFIVVKNKLNPFNNFEVLFFSSFILLFPETLLNTRIIWANFLVLLALRRLISISSKIEVRLKLFDAAFYIAIATLCYFWAILFIILIFIVLLLYGNNNFKDWLVPIVGLACVLIINASVSILVYGTSWDFFSGNYNTSLQFSNYNSTISLIALTVLFSFGLWALFNYSKQIKMKTRKFKISHRIILATLILAFIIAVISPIKNGSEFLFLFGPLAIVTANYIASISDQWFKELFFGLLFISPFVLLVLQLFSKS